MGGVEEPIVEISDQSKHYRRTGKCDQAQEYLTDCDGDAP